MSEKFDKYSELDFVVGSADTIDEMISVPPMRPFADEVIEFLNDLSKVLMKHREYSDVVTLGFWCRKSAIAGYKKDYHDLDRRVGRGIALHIAPSNVAVNFAFSLFSSLLSGNANIVRLPSKEFEQVEIIHSAISALLATTHQNIAPYICMIRYPSTSSQITSALSALCDSRIIWGGDDTIAQIQKSQLKPRATEITFADRYSISVINAGEYLASDKKEIVAQSFYVDTYFSDQNACTSPRIVIWLGKDKKQAKEDFWHRVHQIVVERYDLSPVQAVGKLHAAYRAAVYRDVSVVDEGDELIYRLQVTDLDSDLMEYKYNSGFFYEYDATSLHEIISISSQKCQTLTYFGVSKSDLEDLFMSNNTKGIDRIVPFGKSMDFTLVWDGYDLINSLSRKITIL